MTSHVDYFGCRHPIVCAAMNQVSDAALAIAVYEAGAFPSLSVANFIKDNVFSVQAYKNELSTYKDATGSDNLLLSIGARLLLQEAAVRPFLKLGFRHIELFHSASTEPIWKDVMALSHRLAGEHGVKFLFKVSTAHVAQARDYQTVLLKGPEGAGRLADDAPPLSPIFDLCRSDLPATNFIVSGGIHRADQVRDYMSRGALAVAIGSLFAASKESAVADSVKRKIIASSSRDLQTMGAHKLRGLFSSVQSDDDANLTKTLRRGMRDADRGGVFMGNAIDHITEVLSVQDIVNRLVARPG